MKNKKILALLLACTIMASGVPVYAADFSDGTAESVQDAESSLFGMEDSELTEDTMPAFADMEENADAAQITDGNREEEDLTGDKTEDKGTEGLEYEYVPEIDGYRVKKGVNEKEIRIPEKYEGKEVLETIILKQEIEQLYRAYEACLKETEKIVLRSRYGLFGGKEQTQREIADGLGISRSYVSRIEKRALEKMRRGFAEHK